MSALGIVTLIAIVAIWLLPHYSRNMDGDRLRTWMGVRWIRKAGKWEVTGNAWRNK